MIGQFSENMHIVKEVVVFHCMGPCKWIFFIYWWREGNVLLFPLICPWNCLKFGRQVRIFETGVYLSMYFYVMVCSCTFTFQWLPLMKSNCLQTGDFHLPVAIDHPMVKDYSMLPPEVRNFSLKILNFSNFVVETSSLFIWYVIGE